MLRVMTARQPTVRASRLCIAALATACCIGSAQAEQQQQQRKAQKPLVTLPSLTAQGFEIKASLGSSLVLQKGKDVWICDMLTIKSSCDPAQ